MQLRVLSAFASLVLAAGCSGDSDSAPGTSPDGGTSPEASAPAPFVLESPAFEEGGTIPAGHRCANSPSPPLEWSGAPAGTESFAVVMRDLDFQSGFLHWVIYDIPKATTGLPENVPPGYEPATPAGAKQAMVLGQGYFGPCSPSTTNTYEFTLYALGEPTLSGVASDTAGAAVVTAIEAAAIDETTLSGESGP